MKRLWLPHVLNKITSATLTCCVLVVCARSFAETHSAETLPSVEEHDGTLYYKPSYFREYHVDWEHGFQEGLGEVEVNGKWGYINSVGQIVIRAKFDEVSGFHEGLGIARSGAIINDMDGAFLGLYGTCYYIDKKGRIVHKMEGGHFSEGLATFCILGKWRIALWEGSLSRDKGKYGFIDQKGKMAIAPKYSWVESFSEGLAGFEDPNEKYGYINARGEVAIEPRYDVAGAFSEGMAEVGIIVAGGKSAKLGFINKRGQEVIPLQYKSVEKFSEGLAAVRKGNKWGYINKVGRLVIPFKFDKAESFSEGYAAVIVGGRLGYINTDGKYVIGPRFEHFRWWGTPTRYRAAPSVSSFSEGLAAVLAGRKWGYIDKKGNFVIEPKFDLAGPFTEGFAKVAIGDKLGYIDKQGKYIWEPTR